MLNRLLKVSSQGARTRRELTGVFLVIAHNALAQEESEEFGGDFNDPMIDLNLDKERDGCAC